MADTKTDRRAWPPEYVTPALPPAEQPAGLAFHPEPPVMNFEAYGVKLEFCEDGDIIAEGHHSTLRFVAAANRVARVDLGLHNIWDDAHATYDDVAAGVTQAWAVRLPKCDCSPEHLAAWGCNAQHDQDRDADYWRITWHGADGALMSAETPGVRPYTIGRW
jgi:hypothetical protein